MSDTKTPRTDKEAKTNRNFQALCKSLELESNMLLDHLDYAWGIIANASGGDWKKESKDWQEAAARWRDTYHEILSAASESEGVMSSDTPRSDEVPHNVGELAMFCRKLERELGIAVHKIAVWKTERDALKAKTDAELSDLRKELEDNRNMLRVVGLDFITTREKLDAAESRNKELEGALESIEEYWNGSNNERAMQDACEYAVETARAALAKKDAAR